MSSATLTIVNNSKVPEPNPNPEKDDFFTKMVLNGYCLSQFLV